jgi:urease
MLLVPREADKLALSAAGYLAQRRLARGLRLNVIEATALIATVLHELVRDGEHSVADLMSLGARIDTLRVEAADPRLGKRILGKRHVLASVPPLL